MAKFDVSYMFTVVIVCVSGGSIDSLAGVRSRVTPFVRSSVPSVAPFLRSFAR